ncbi:ATP-binding cassette sub-family G member 3, partial [Lemmus lemmus]
YRVSSYFLGKLLGDVVPRRLLPNIIFAVIVFIIAGVGTDVKGFFSMIFTIMMLTCSASSLLLSTGVGQIAGGEPTTFFVTIYFVLMLFFLGLSLYFINSIQDFSWIQYLSIPHYGLTAFLHNELLGQNFCPENKTAEVSKCQNFVICTGEEYLMIQSIDLSSWGFWKNHVALGCITIISFLSNYVELLAYIKIRHFLKRSCTFIELNWP